MKRGMNPELGLAILRIVLGFIFVAHGWPKVGSIEGTAGFLGGIGIPLPAIAAWAVTILELGGGILLLAGFLVTPVALLLTAHMLLGIIMVHAANGFYVLDQGSGGIEFNLLLAASSMMLVFGGPGLAALDSRNHS
jgi:putative oxidoreductase